MTVGDAPEAIEHLLDRIDQLTEDQPWHGERADKTTPEPVLAGVIGSSRGIRDVFALVKRASNSGVTVLIAGETGTGKEVIARAVHASGPRSAKPFVAVNCAAFPDSLLESELFGHVRGAFTSGDRLRQLDLNCDSRGTIGVTYTG